MRGHYVKTNAPREIAEAAPRLLRPDSRPAAPPTLDDRSTRPSCLLPRPLFRARLRHAPPHLKLSSARAQGRSRPARIAHLRSRVTAGRRLTIDLTLCSDGLVHR